MTTSKVQIIEKIFNANDQLAANNRQLLDDKKIFAINMMASPGAGKTSLILKTIQLLAPRVRIGVIEGDTAPVTIDADKVIAAGMPAVQINTGGDCHLDAAMMRDGIAQLPLDDIDLLIVENVGNLICPAGFNLGTHSNVVIASVPEGDDKPYKYPNIYRGIDVLILNKMDLIPYIDFRQDYFSQGIRIQNPKAEIIQVSCRTGEGVQSWCDWLSAKVNQVKG
ncbi:MAG: hydrogenase nickel incorporation protein HypB [Chloroflexi bacterium]|nr:hydrogenase nickel incorporation protein HypB [Chloroflexota bacterium]